MDGALVLGFGLRAYRVRVSGLLTKKARVPPVLM